MRASKHHKLDEDEELKSFYKIVIAQQEGEAKKRIAEATTPQETLNKLFAEGRKLGKPEIKADGTLTWDYFIDSFGLCLKYIVMQTEKGLVERKEKRRQLCKDEDDEGFNKLILETANWEKLTCDLLHAAFYQTM